MKRKTKRGGKKKNTRKISKKKRVSPQTSRRSRMGGPGDLELLEMLIKKIIEKLEKNSCEAKVQDALKAIQLKLKLAPASDAGFSSGKNRICQA